MCTNEFVNQITLYIYALNRFSVVSNQNVYQLNVKRNLVPFFELPVFENGM